jgi:hypothetical protein
MRTSITAALCLMLLTAPRARADGDGFTEHYDRALQLIAADRYDQALVELNVAYSIRQLPKLLRQIAAAHRRLGHVQEAIAYDQRYLVAETDATAPERIEAHREIVELTPMAQALAPPPGAAAPAPGVMYAPVHYESRRNRGMIAGGASLLATSYTAALVSGAVFLAFSSNSNSDFRTASGLLMVPLLGPFISSITYREVAWSVPWSVVDGTAQGAGLALLIAGAMSKRRVTVLGEHLQIVPTGTGVLATGSF